MFENAGCRVGREAGHCGLDIERSGDLLVLDFLFEKSEHLLLVALTAEELIGL